MQNLELLNVKLVVHHVTSGFSKVKNYELNYVPYSQFYLCSARLQIGTRSPRVEVSRSETHRHTHTREDFSERDINPSQKPLPTQHATNTTDRSSMPSAGSDPATLTSSRQQTYALDRTATGIGFTAFYSENRNYCRCVGKGAKLRPVSKTLVAL